MRSYDEILADAGKHHLLPRGPACGAPGCTCARDTCNECAKAWPCITSELATALVVATVDLREAKSEIEAAYKTIRACVGEPEPTPDSRKKQNEGEGAPQAADAQSTPAGEGLPPLCRVCGGRIAAHPELFAWEHIREPSWNHRAELLEHS